MAFMPAPVMAIAMRIVTMTTVFVVLGEVPVVPIVVFVAPIVLPVMMTTVMLALVTAIIVVMAALLVTCLSRDTEKQGQTK